MSQLLISVRNLDEARTVARHAVGILDIKEPQRGALGAADPSVIGEIAEAIAPDIRKSFSAGELSDWIVDRQHRTAKSLRERYGNAILSQFQFVKIGLASMAGNERWKFEWQRLFEGLPKNTRAVMVAYLDHERCAAPGPTEVIEFASRVENCSAVLLDTYHKQGNLFSHLSTSQLIELVALAKRNHLMSVVAGSVDQKSIVAVRQADPEYIGMRGAVCKPDRNGTIDEALVRQMFSLVHI